MIVIVGASASGKSTLQKKMLKQNKNLKKVITYTTRPPRRGEKAGVDYHFVTENRFRQLLDEGFFVEHAEYRGWLYGTAKEDCHDSNDYIAVLTPSGLRALKRTGTKTLSVYLFVDRRSLLLNILQRGDDVDESYRRNLSDHGQFDGVEDEVDYIIDNTAFHMDENEVLKVMNTILKVAENERV